MGRKHAKHQPAIAASVSRVFTRQVLETHELLYCICSFMDISTLIHAQRVCKRWHEMISTSSLLQQKLYLKPWLSTDKEQGRVINPLLLRHFEPILAQKKTYWYWDHALYPSALKVPEMSIANMKNDRRIHKAFIRRGSTWRKMLVTQPPIMSIGYVSIINRDKEWSLLSFPEGLRMGDLYDMVFQAIWYKPDEAGRCAWVDLPPEKREEDLVQRMSDKYSEKPGLLVKAESRPSTDRGCSQGRCSCNFNGDGICHSLRNEKDRIRKYKATRWMFECEEYEEKDYMSLGKRCFTIP